MMTTLVQQVLSSQLNGHLQRFLVIPALAASLTSGHMVSGHYVVSVYICLYNTFSLNFGPNALLI